MGQALSSLILWRLNGANPFPKSFRKPETSEGWFSSRLRLLVLLRRHIWLWILDACTVINRTVGGTRQWLWRAGLNHHPVEPELWMMIASHFDGWGKRFCLNVHLFTITNIIRNDLCCIDSWNPIRPALFCPFSRGLVCEIPTYPFSIWPPHPPVHPPVHPSVHPPVRSVTETLTFNL